MSSSSQAETSSYQAERKLFSTPASRWAALTVRDQRADTHFVYAVRSTKIYCRPICPSRLARRANVEFFDTPLQAVAAGYRACKRCKPETAQQFEAVDDEGKRRNDGIQRAIDLIKVKNGVATLDEVAKEAAVGGKWHFLRMFKEKTGETPGAMMTRLRKTKSDGVNRSPIEGVVADGHTGSHSAAPSQIQDRLEAAWTTTDPAELEQMFQDMFPSEIGVNDLELHDNIFPPVLLADNIEFPISAGPSSEPLFFSHDDTDTGFDMEDVIDQTAFYSEMMEKDNTADFMSKFVSTDDQFPTEDNTFASTDLPP